MNDHPWTLDTAALGAPIRWRFSFEVHASPQEFWPILIDTTRLNRALGLSAIEYIEEGGRLKVSTRLRGIPYRWVELPWAWVAGKWVSCFRIYESGLATHGAIRFALEPLDAARTEVNIEFDWYPRNAPSRLLFPLIEPWVRERYDRALRRIERELAERRPIHMVLAQDAQPLSPEPRRRLAAARARLLGEGVRAEVIDRLFAHIEEGDEIELARIRVRVLSHRFHLAERDLILACLHATRAGVLQIGWDLICPHCRGVRHTANTLADVPPRASCAVCESEFPADGPNAVEVTFQVHPSIRAVQKLNYCLAEASSKAHIRLQQPIPPGQRRSFATALDPGRYRLRVIGEDRHRFLDIAPGSPASEVTLDERAEGAIEAGPAPVITLVNTSDRRRVFVLEDVQWADDALRPVHLFNLQEFRDLFSAEQLAADVGLQVGEQTILFSDMVGSTRFYERHGDARAFAAVKRHFREVYEGVRKNRGVVVKTIGDAAMAAFVDPADALRAALGLQRCFRADSEHDGIRLRISLNVGSCIAVNLNSGIDYFGRTVNLAAKLQASVSAGQIAFPAAMRDDVRVEAFLKEQELALEEVLLTLPSFGEPIKVYRLDTNGAGPGGG